MTHVDSEIASQPDCWRRAAELAGASGLPASGERVAVVGCGTSWFMAQAYAALRERAGHGETDAFQASEFPAGRRYDRIVAITRSGTTTEVLDVLSSARAPSSSSRAPSSSSRAPSSWSRAMPSSSSALPSSSRALPSSSRPLPSSSRPLPSSSPALPSSSGALPSSSPALPSSSRARTTVITADASQPAAGLATDAVVLDFADEQSVVQTRFATSTLALLRAHLGADIGPIACDAEVAVRLPLPVRDDVEQLTFLGRGWTIGLAAEAALKCRETAMVWAEAYPAMDYRHGPISIAGPGRVVWAFGEVPARLADDVEATGAAFVHARHHGGFGALGRWCGGRTPMDPMADLIVAQRVAVRLAVARGLDPDHPRNLTRSVVLA